MKCGPGDCTSQDFDKNVRPVDLMVKINLLREINIAELSDFVRAW